VPVVRGVAKTAAVAAFCPTLLLIVGTPEEVPTRLPELPPAKEAGDDAVFIGILLESPPVKDVGDEASFVGLWLEVSLAKDVGDELVFMMQLRSLCLILLVKDAGAKAVLMGLLLESPLAKEAFIIFSFTLNRSRIF